MGIAWKRWTQLTETKVQHQTTSRGLVWRSLGMLRAVRGLIVVLFLLGVVASALPYVSAAAFGPMMQVVADAGASGNLSGVWDLQGPLLASEDDLLGSLAGPVVPFAVLLTAWAVSLLLAQLMYFVNAWVGAKVEQVLVTDIRQRVHDHIQTLSLNFFTGARSGALMQRVLAETAGVQRLLTGCLLPPLIDSVVLDCGNRLSADHIVADDGRRAGPYTAGHDLAAIRRPPRPGGDATDAERRPRHGR